MNRIPKCISKFSIHQANNIKPSPKEPSKENLAQKISKKMLKFSGSRHFGKDITNNIKSNMHSIYNNHCTKIVTIVDKKQNGNSIYIKKHSSTSQVAPKPQKIKNTYSGERKIRENKSNSVVNKKNDVVISESYYYKNSNYNNSKKEYPPSITQGGNKLHGSISFGINANSRPVSYNNSSNTNNNKSISVRISNPKGNVNSNKFYGNLNNRSINSIHNNNISGHNYNYNFTNNINKFNNNKNDIMNHTHTTIELINHIKSTISKDSMINTINQSCINNSKGKKSYNKDKDKDKVIIKEVENELKKEKAEHRSIYEIKNNNSQIKILEHKKINDENKENINTENIAIKKEKTINKETIINNEKDNKDKEAKEVVIDNKENKNEKENLDNIQYKEIIETNKENKDKIIEKEIKDHNINPKENQLTKFNSEQFEDDEVKIKYFDTSKVTNVQIPKDYLNIIYYNLLKEEDKGIIPMPDYTYLNRQTEINEKMRSILVDWLIDVHFKFGFTDETLFMTISIIDRYLSISQITRTNFQLLGITALMIACKHEEIDLPKIDDFIYITDNAYVKSEVVKMEEDVLSKLNFAFMYPSPIKFFEYLSFHFNFEKKHHMMGKYLMESFLLDVKNCKYKPSIISCACAYIVMKFFKMKNYQESYQKKFYNLDENKEKYSEHNIKECAKDICLYVDNINKTNYQACVKKYSKPEQENVAVIIMNN